MYTTGTLLKKIFKWGLLTFVYELSGLFMYPKAMSQDNCFLDALSGFEVFCVLYCLCKFVC